jgi:2-iminobutanoate/2-iminopropanoate deaminase
MAKQIIVATKSPKAIGPYSSATKVGNMIWCAGQIPLDADGKFVQGDIKVQTEQCLKNVKNLLADAGATLDNVVKVTVFMKDLNMFAQMNEVYGQYFTANYPARSTIEVARIPLDSLVEIEVIAVI